VPGFVAPFPPKADLKSLKQTERYNHRSPSQLERELMLYTNLAFHRTLRHIKEQDRGFFRYFKQQRRPRDDGARGRVLTRGKARSESKQAQR
jgi:hypothetical protein